MIKVMGVVFLSIAGDREEALPAPCVFLLNISLCVGRRRTPPADLLETCSHKVCCVRDFPRDEKFASASYREEIVIACLPALNWVSR